MTAHIWKKKDLLPLVSLWLSLNPLTPWHPLSVSSFVFAPCLGRWGGGGEHEGLSGQTGDKITSCDAILNTTELFLESRLLKIAPRTPPGCKLIGEAIKRRLAL